MAAKNILQEAFKVDSPTLNLSESILSQAYLPVEQQPDFLTMLMGRQFANPQVGLSPQFKNQGLKIPSPQRFMPMGASPFLSGFVPSGGISGTIKSI